MAQRKSWNWRFTWCGLFASLTFLCLANRSALAADHLASSEIDDVVVDDVDQEGPVPVGPEDTPSQGEACHTDHAKNRFLMLVSTLDGKVSALNVGNAGALEWSVDAGSSPLISSSISQLEITRNGIPTRLIPSLDGALFQFDGEGIEPLPFSADSLLSSTFRFQEDSMVVGGKGSETYGIDCHTGKVQYMCSAAGCKTFGDGSAVEDDILVITRHTKTVRAVEMKTGTEKWNFSVGEHEMSYIRSSRTQVYDYIGHEHGGRQPAEKAVPNKQCENLNDDDLDDWLDLSWFLDPDADLDLDDIELKVIVPSGLVAAVSKKNPGQILWRHRFPNAIANAWTLRDGQLAEVSLFDDTHIPALSQDLTDTPAEQDTAPSPPLLYVGSYHSQLYVQPSVLLNSELEQAVARTEPGGLVSMPRVLWRPYLATAVTRTPAVTSARNPLQISWDQEDQEDNEHGVAVWHEEYPYDGGFYLFPDYTPITLHPNEGNTSNTGNQSIFNKYIATIMVWNWWKEVVAASVVISIGVHLVIMKYIRKSTQTGRSLTPSKSVSQEDQLTMESEIAVEKQAEEKTAPTVEYVSRYYTDFEQELCLGHGGFGVVYQARNKMDDCEYAMKRITLNNSERAKQKVMREVKALAKLDHAGIVRYYQSWFENPPCGWQEEIDRKTADMSSFTPTMGDYTPGSHLPGARGEGAPPPLRADPLLPFGSPEVTEDSEPRRAGSTEGFVPHKGVVDDDESGSFSSESFARQTEDSFDISFRDDSKDSGSLPFEDYGRRRMFDGLNESLDIVFEDSGCDDDKTSTGSGGHEHAVIDISKSQSDHQNRRSARSKQSLTSKSVKRPAHLALSGGDSVAACNALPKLYLYIQMQLCQRESLKDWLNTNTLHRDRAQQLSIFQQIVEAVDYVHSNGLMHRDLKPSNIFFSKDGVVKVGDFGLVTALEEQFDTESELQGSPIHHKHTNQVGTKLYMSPEQTAGRTYTHSVDIYALGMIFVELFYPFATQMERIKTLMAIRELNFPQRFIRELPTEHDFVLPLLSHSPSERPDTGVILATPLLLEARDIVQLTSRTRTRTRTTSSSSGSSVTALVQ